MHHTHSFAVALLTSWLLAAPTPAQDLMEEDLNIFLGSLDDLADGLQPIVDLQDMVAARIQLVESIADGPGMPDAMASANAIWSSLDAGPFVFGASGIGSTVAGLPTLFPATNGTLVGSGDFVFHYAGYSSLAYSLPSEVPSTAIAGFCFAATSPTGDVHLGVAASGDASQLPQYSMYPSPGFTFLAAVPLTGLPDGPLSGAQVAEAWTRSINGDFAAPGAMTAWLEAQLGTTAPLSAAQGHHCINAVLDALDQSLLALVNMQLPSIIQDDEELDALLATPTAEAMRGAGEAIGAALPGLSIVEGFVDALADGIALAEGAQSDTQFSDKVAELQTNLDNRINELEEVLCEQVAQAINNLKGCINSNWGEGTWDLVSSEVEDWVEDNYGC